MNLNGLHREPTTYERPIYGSSRLGIMNKAVVFNMNGGLVSKSTSTIGIKEYELSDHLGNVSVVVLDQKNCNNSVIKPVVKSYTDYYPFGYPISFRTDNFNYRYGFNGQEGDGEIYGDKLNYAFTYRMYDARIGRFWSVDPLKKIYPYYSSYQFAGNSPIWAKELEGLEPGTVNAPKSRVGTYNKKTYKKFDIFVTNPLTKLLDNGASEEEIQSEADRLAKLYQDERWLQHTIRDRKYSELSGTNQSSTTGWDQKTQIIIVAFTQTSNKHSTEAKRENYEGEIFNKSFKVTVVPGSTLSVKFEPFGAYNSLTIYSIDSEGKENEILNTGMINDKYIKIYTYEIEINDQNIKEIRYEIKLSILDPIQDNWKINLEFKNPKKFDPHGEIKLLRKDEENY